MASERAAVEAGALPFALAQPFEGPALDPSLLAMTGLEQVRAHVRGEVALAPISRLLGLRPIEADLGSAAFALPASGWLAGPDGRPQPGVLATLADAAHAGAVASALPPGNVITTVCLTLDYLGPVEAVGEAFACRARLDGGGADGALAHTTATIEDGRGRLVARSTARSAVHRLPGAATGGEPGDRTGAPPPAGSPGVPEPGPDASGETLPADAWQAATGAELLDRLCGAGAPLPPIGRLTGLRAASGGDGSARFELPATTWVSSVVRQVQGGTLAMLAEAALDAAVLSTLARGGRRETVELRVDFLRKVPAGDEVLAADASLVHRGRSFAFARCTVSSDARGPVAAATSVHRF